MGSVRKPGAHGNGRTRSLAKAKPRGWYTPSIVEEVIREFCDGNAEELRRRLEAQDERAAAEEKRKPRTLSKQHILGWRARGQFPIEWVTQVYAITRLPMARLIHRTRPRS